MGVEPSAMFLGWIIWLLVNLCWYAVCWHLRLQASSYLNLFIEQYLVFLHGSRFQGTNNQLALLEKMNDRVAQEYSNYGVVASGLRVFVEQLNKKSRGFDEYESQIDAIDQQVTEFEAVVSMLDKHVALLEKKVKSAYHISSSTQWFLIQNSGSFANTWAYPRNVCYILEMLIFQHRNDAVRSQVVHLCCSNCRAFVASSQQLDFCQELDAWDLHRPDLRALIIIAYCFHKKPVPVDFWRTGLAAVCSVHACYQDSSRFFNPWNRLHGTGQWHVEALELNPVALKFLGWMISHAAWHLILLLSSQIVLELWTDYQLQVLSMSSTHTLHQH